jgi:hypothetical protein
VRDVLGDPDRPRKSRRSRSKTTPSGVKIQITNPSKRRKTIMATKRELEERVDDWNRKTRNCRTSFDAMADIVALEEENEEQDDGGRSVDDADQD